MKVLERGLSDLCRVKKLPIVVYYHGRKLETLLLGVECHRGLSIDNVLVMD